MFGSRMIALGAAAVAALASLRCASGGLLVAPSVSESLNDARAQLAADTNDPVAYYNVAMAYWSKRRYDQADSSLRRAVALDPEFALAHLADALVQLPNKAHWEALKRAGGDTAVVQELRARGREYSRAFLIDPFVDVRAVGLVPTTYANAYAQLSLEMAYIRDHFGRPLDSMPRVLVWAHAIAAEHSNHLSDAIADVQSLGRVSRRRDESEFLSAAPLETNEYLYMLAALLQRAGYAADAAKLYQSVAAGDLGNYEVHVQLARIYEGQHDWGHALQESRAAVALYPENHRLVMDLGLAEYHAGVLPDAEATLRDARDAAPQDFVVAYWLGEVQRARQEKADARATLETYLRLAPSRDSVEVAQVRAQLHDLQ